MLHTNYATLSNSSSSDQDFLPLSYAEGERVCHTNGGEVMTFDPYMMSTVRELLNAWGHSEVMGGVWMARDGRQCKSIQVGGNEGVNLTAILSTMLIERCLIHNAL